MAKDVSAGGVPVPAGRYRVEQFRARYPGEGQQIEFKQGLSADRIVEAVTGFSNATGGVLFLGVRPDGTPAGVNVDGEARARVLRMIANVHQPGRHELRTVTVGGRPLLAIIVQPRRGGFAQTPDGRVLVRRDAMTVPLKGEELVEFVRRKTLTRFELTGLQVQLAEADPQLVHDVARAFGWTDDVGTRLVEAGLAIDVATERMLTVAGALYLLDDPGAVLGKSHIEVFRFRDDGPTEDRRELIRGPLHHQVEEAVQLVGSMIGTDIVVLGLHRYELDRLPTEVLREAVANAVAHRVYEDARRPIRIEIRPARVNVTSPGPLPEPVTVDSMREQNAARNISVINVLRRFRLAEDAGKGVDLIQDRMTAELLEEPVFSADEASVRVSLPLTSTVTPTERAWVREVESRGELRGNERAILVAAARGEVLTNSAVRSLLRLDSTDARTALQRLRDAGFLEQRGERSGARYILATGITPPSGLRLHPEDLRRGVLQVALDEGAVTNRGVRERFALDRAEALRLLQSLVASGDLSVIGTRRGARYVPNQTGVARRGRDT